MGNIFESAGTPALSGVLGPPERRLSVSRCSLSGSRVEAQMTTGPWNRRGDGTASHSALGVLVDDVVGNAALLYRDPESWAVTTELSLDILAPLPADGSLLTCRAVHLGQDETSCYAAGEVRTDSGTLLARASSWLIFVPGVPEKVRGQHTAPATIPPADALEEALGRPDANGPGGDTFPARSGAFHATEWQLNPAGAIHGGMVAGMCGLAAEEAVAGTGVRLQSLRVTFLRPGRGIQVPQTRVIHNGNRLKKVSVSLMGPSGKPTASAEAVLRP
ncbi:hypothetical protein GCM10009596_28510 [Arthrobacter rhombi]|uniref:PaaI family thioesterase n=1 Tax=Arthrobacter rhombi TaxID=71253 RepID=UPI0031DFA070